MNFNLEKAPTLIFDKLQGWMELGIQMLPNVLIAAFFLVLFYAIARLAERVINNGLGRVSRNSAANDLVSTIARVAIILVGIFVSLGVLNLDRAVTSLLAGAGVIGLVLGFAFQEIAANFIAGIIIAFRQPFRVGDIVEVKDVLGKIRNIDLRTTTIVTLQGLDVIMPNKDMFTAPVTNYTSTPERRVDVEVGVSYGDDLEKVKQVTMGAVHGVENQIKDRPVEFFYTGFGSSSIQFVVRIWISDPQQISYFKTVDALIRNIKRAFDENAITIPFPIRTLDFGIKGGKSLEESWDRRPGE